VLAIEWPDRLTHPFPDAIDVTFTVVDATTRDVAILGDPRGPADGSRD
jgi:hypothetical protein